MPVVLGDGFGRLKGKKGLGEGQLQRHFGSDQSVWRGGDWNGFVRIVLAGLLAPHIELARSA